jgi:hypothetical protein
MRNSGGKWGKLKGFDFYLRYEDRLRPNQRKIFLERSEDYISQINLNSINKIPHMDSGMSDRELVDVWNEIYDKWGFLIEGFRDKWIKEFVGHKY